MLKWISHTCLKDDYSIVENGNFMVMQSRGRLYNRTDSLHYFPLHFHWEIRIKHSADAYMDLPFFTFDVSVFDFLFPFFCVWVSFSLSLSLHFPTPFRTCVSSPICMPICHQHFMADPFGYVTTGNLRFPNAIRARDVKGVCHFCCRWCFFVLPANNGCTGWRTLADCFDFVQVISWMGARVPTPT